MAMHTFWHFSSKHWFHMTLPKFPYHIPAEIGWCHVSWKGMTIMKGCEVLVAFEHVDDMGKTAMHSHAVWKLLEQCMINNIVMSLHCERSTPDAQVSMSHGMMDDYLLHCMMGKLLIDILYMPNYRIWWHEEMLIKSTSFRIPIIKQEIWAC